MHIGFKFFTSESVLPGHPDKIADRISDLILDEYLRRDPESRTAIEVLVTHKKIIISGEANGPQIPNVVIEGLVRDLLKDIGYTPDLLDYSNIEIVNLLHKQSNEIASGIKKDQKLGAGDQGMMFGYACDETENFMPAPIYYAHKILQNISANTKLGPDGKSQITIKYNNKNQPIGFSNIVVSVQHSEELSYDVVKEIVYQQVRDSLPWDFDTNNIFVNPAGKFTRGGPISDCGLTGRKIVVDTYGGMIPNGGGAFSGKDYSKVDRSAAYMSRYIAKNIVAAKLARRCSVQICYAIGLEFPLSFQINTHGTGVIEDDAISRFIEKNIDLSPCGIKNTLKLDNPIYLPTATYGHFGRDCFTWENCDMLDLLRACAGELLVS